VAYEARDLEHWDTSLLVFVVRLERIAREHSFPTSREALPEGLQRLVDMAFAVPPASGAKGRKDESGLYVRLGKLVLDIPVRLADILSFQGALVLSFWRLLRGKSDMRLKDLLHEAVECGVRALPIVMLTSMLFGMILAFMGAVQLTQFGAQIYVAGLVGIAMLRVMGAVLVGVVMSGRTGAAYAAMIGTMQVNEEVDALITFGVSPMDYLVLPRVLALFLMVPLLTLYADLMGVIGGFLVGVFMLDLPPHAYYNATVNRVALRQLLVGLAYATSFGIIVGLCGCYQGMRCGRSAEAVGKAATSAVVSSIVCIIVATAIITVLCNLLQI
jgi:phospholipid/cholesterol/gamma-HCH transport system permease protein